MIKCCLMFICPCYLIRYILPRQTRQRFNYFCKVFFYNCRYQLNNPNTLFSLNVSSVWGESLSQIFNKVHSSVIDRAHGLIGHEDEVVDATQVDGIWQSFSWSPVGIQMLPLQPPPTHVGRRYYYLFDPRYQGFIRWSKNVRRLLALKCQQSVFGVCLNLNFKLILVYNDRFVLLNNNFD